jgi:dolichyl-phosphate beta-glucosyltransferase
LPSLSVVIPAYNEELRLPSTLETLLAYLRNEANGAYGPWELIVVNDGSKDATAAIAKRLAVNEPNICILENPGNKGKGYSVKHGMLEARYDWVLFSDADLSAPIAEVSKLFEAASRQQAEIAIGSRALDRSLIGTHQSGLRELGGRVFNVMAQLGAGLRLWDTQCGFKLFRRDAARAVFKRLRLERFGFDVEALFVARSLGYRIVEVPVRWSHVDGTKVSLVTDSVDMFGDIARVRWNAWKGLYR